MAKNNIDIIGIHDKKIKLPQKPNKEFASLDEYITIAKKCISRHANKFRPNLAKEMLGNEDAVSNIAHAAMMADWAFNGKGSLHGFRKERILFAIRCYLTRSCKNNKRNTLSLNRLINSDKSQSTTSFLDRLVDKSPTVEDTMFQKEKIEKLKNLIKEANIPKNAKKYIQMHFFEGQSIASIAKKNGVSRQGIYTLIDRSLSNIRKSGVNDDFFRSIISND